MGKALRWGVWAPWFFGVLVFFVVCLVVDNLVLQLLNIVDVGGEDIEPPPYC